MQTVMQGRPITLVGRFQYATGGMVDPDTVTVDLRDQSNSLVVNDGSTNRDDIGVYSYTYTVPVDASTGLWTVSWTGTLGGISMSSSEQFQVSPSVSIMQMRDVINRLRRMLGERIPVGGTEQDTRFLDQDIVDTWIFNGTDLNKTMAELWAAKSAYFSDLVDISESGTTRALSQMGKAAIRQFDLWESRAKAEDAAWSASYRIPGKSIDIYNRRSRGITVMFNASPQRAWTYCE